jgi:hypothetical protein
MYSCAVDSRDVILHRCREDLEIIHDHHAHDPLDHVLLFTLAASVVVWIAFHNSSSSNTNYEHKFVPTMQLKYNWYSYGME